MIGDRCEYCHEKGHAASNFKATSVSDDVILAMRSMRQQGLSYQEISDEFGSTREYVKRICTGKSRLAAGGYIEVKETV